MLKPCLHSAQVGEAQGCLHSGQVGEEQGTQLQPGIPSVEVTGKRSSPHLVMEVQTYCLTVLRAHSLPRLKTLFGKKRRFYVTVINGTIAKQTSAIRSVEQAVEWNEKLGAL